MQRRNGVERAAAIRTRAPTVIAHCAAALLQRFNGKPAQYVQPIVDGHNNAACTRTCMQRKRSLVLELQSIVRILRRKLGEACTWPLPDMSDPP